MTKPLCRYWHIQEEQQKEIHTIIKESRDWSKSTQHPDHLTANFHIGSRFIIDSRFISVIQRIQMNSLFSLIFEILIQQYNITMTIVALFIFSHYDVTLFKDVPKSTVILAKNIPC